MVTYHRDLLMAFVYFDQSHCGYLHEKDLEEILYTLGLHLSRAQVLLSLPAPSSLEQLQSDHSRTEHMYLLLN